MKIDILSDDMRTITDDNNLCYILNATGTYIANYYNQERPKIYKIDIDGKEYHILGNDNSVSINKHIIQRVDELVYTVFNEELLNEDDILIHMDDYTLNDSRDNLNKTTLRELVSLEDIQYEVDESKVSSDIIKLTSKSQQIEARYRDLIKELQKNPYKLSKRFTPTHGLQYKGYKGLYHAVIDKSLKDRIFYRILENKIIIDKVDIKGIVKILQARGHDWNKKNDIKE